MKRSGFLKRTKPLRSRKAEGPDRVREPHPVADAVAAIHGNPAFSVENVARDVRAALSVKPLHRGTYSGASSGVPVAKEEASQHAGYMNAVRDLGYCMNCGRTCRPQFCHADQGKGMGIKTDVRRGWPGCPECHWLIGTSGTYTKDERRGIEARLAHKTRQAVLAAGTWPARLPMWEGA